LELFYNEFREFQDLQSPEEVIIEFKSLRNNRDELKERYDTIKRKKYQEMNELKLNLNKDVQDMRDRLAKAEKENQELKEMLKDYESNNNSSTVSL